MLTVIRHITTKAIKMLNVITTERIPIKSWCSDIDDNALAQAKNAANLPFAFHHVALMPDCHMGFGAPIGGVLACMDVIIPNFVGVDIGCGMCAMELQITHIDLYTLNQIINDVRKLVPVGFNRQAKSQDPSLIKYPIGLPICENQYESALTQLGTLGGGNHFIEIQQDTEDGKIWVMIHSGSRNVGKQVAEHYNEYAIEMNKKWYSSVPESLDLAFLPADSPIGRQYIDEMKWCVEFALANRTLMMKHIIMTFAKYLGNSLDVDSGDLVNIPHNYVALENHFGENVWVHRKGATLAREGVKGIIPGSQGTRSYITLGRGNPHSFNSCSHGAGRKMGRKAAQRNLNLADEKAILDKQGIIHGIRSAADLDEASGAYKDINTVIANQMDLIHVTHELRPLAVIKG